MRRHPVHAYFAAAFVLLLACAMAWAWHAHGYTAQDALAQLRAYAEEPAAPLVVVALYVACGFAFVPVMALIAVTGLVFTPGIAAVYAMLGACASAAASYAAGRYLSHGLLVRHAGPRITAVRRHLKARGLLAVILVRVVPSGPFTLLNLVAGASSIRFRDFMLGTVIGLAPGIAVTVGLVHGVRRAWQAPDARTVAVAALAALLAAGLAWFARRAVRKRGDKPPASS